MESICMRAWGEEGGVHAQMLVSASSRHSLGTQGASLQNFTCLAKNDWLPLADWVSSYTQQMTLAPNNRPWPDRNQYFTIKIYQRRVKAPSVPAAFPWCVNIKSDTCSTW